MSIVLLKGRLDITVSGFLYEFKKYRNPSWGKLFLLLPIDNNTIIKQWKIQYKVPEVKDNMIDYVIDVKSKRNGYHINMVKKFFQRNDGNVIIVLV